VVGCRRDSTLCLQRFRCASVPGGRQSRTTSRRVARQVLLGFGPWAARRDASATRWEEWMRTTSRLCSWHPPGRFLRGSDRCTAVAGHLGGGQMWSFHRLRGSSSSALKSWVLRDPIRRRDATQEGSSGLDRGVGPRQGIWAKYGANDMRVCGRSDAAAASDEGYSSKGVASRGGDGGKCDFGCAPHQCQNATNPGWQRIARFAPQMRSKPSKWRKTTGTERVVCLATDDRRSQQCDLE